nr:10402_t:CDS:2 [Entrophospora candida]
MSNNNTTTNVTGDQFIRTLAQFIRINERKITIQNPQQQSTTNPSSHLLGSRKSESSFGSSFGIPNFWSISAAITNSYMKSPTTTASTTPTSPISPSSNNISKKTGFVTLDPHHLYYLLARFHDLGFDVGVFETIMNFDNKDIDFDANDSSWETASIASNNSMNSMSSAMSSLSLISGWQGWSNAAQKHENIPIKNEVYYVYKSFTKLTSLKLSSTINNKGIEGGILSMTLFKNLKYLEINGLSPKAFDGWDILQEKLEILTLTKSSIDDITELFIDLVADGAEENGDDGKEISINRKTVIKKKNNDHDDDVVAPLKIWKNLRQVNLSDNALTFIPNEPLIYIAKCTHIDLSNNLLIAIPSGLSQLYNLQYLNLSNNMIETITGIYKILGNVTKLDLRNNRIENLCGLERLYSLEYVDVRENQLTDWAEATRMTELPEMKQIYVDGNPFTRYETNYRINIFKAFKENNKDIILDGTAPTYIERRSLPSNANSPSNQKFPFAILSNENPLSSPNSSNDEQHQQRNNNLPVIRHKKSQKFHKRVVDLDGDNQNKNSDNKITAKAPLPKHRAVEIEKAIAADNSKSHKRRSANKRQNTTPDLSSTKKTPTSPLSSPHSDSETISSPTIGEAIEYRKKIEELRKEGGSSWLTILNEMEYNNNNINGILHSRQRSENQPPKLKAIVDQVITANSRNY